MTVIRNITHETLLKWMQADEAVLVDVREPDEYNTGYIDHAKNLPLSYGSIDANVLEYQHKKLVIYCLLGQRSMVACVHLQNDDAPFDVWNLEGGIAAWKRARLPVKNYCLNAVE